MRCGAERYLRKGLTSGCLLGSVTGVVLVKKEDLDLRNGTTGDLFCTCKI